MTNKRTLLLAGCCLVCLLVVASALPAADPRLDVPGASETQGTTVDDGATDAESETKDEPTEPDDAAISIDEPLVPGTTAELRLEIEGDDSEIPIEVDGESVGTTNQIGELPFSVPYREEVTITASAKESSQTITRTVDVRTNAQITAEKPVLVGERIHFEATVGETPLSDAVVYQDGERVDTTDRLGDATAGSRDETGETELRVERGAVTGEQRVEIAEPSISLDSPLLFPGSVASVTVTANGEPVENAAVMVNGDMVAQTDSNGNARIRLPLANEATVTVNAAAATRTTSVGNLYLRLTTIVVLVPGLIIGSIWAVGRFLAIIEVDVEGPQEPVREPHDIENPAGTSLFVLLGNALDRLASIPLAFVSGITAAVSAFFRGSGNGSFSWPSVPSVGLSFSWPTMSLPSFSGLQLPLSRSSESALGEWFRSEESPTELAGEGVDGDGEHSDEQAEIRAIWGAFLDHLGLEEMETLTAGEVGRRALVIGFPAASVRQLVATFREVEYGGREASIERVATARAALSDLRENDPREESE